MRVPRPSPATVISIVALIVALGGTSYAVSQLPKNSVGTKQLQRNAVTGAKVKNGSLSVRDFGGTLPKGDKGDPGTPGTNGKDGTNGTNGSDGTNGTNGAAFVAHARCPGNSAPCPFPTNHSTQAIGLAGV